MKCGTALAKLAALIDGELTPADAAKIRAHLADCASCSEAADKSERLKQLAAAWTVEGSDVWEAVRAEIETPDVKGLIASIRALQAEVRTLRAEVAELREHGQWAKRGSDLFGPAARTDVSSDQRHWLRIV